MNAAQLIRIISEHSDQRGDKLIDFMERYGINGLIEAKQEQLEEYVKTEFTEVAV